MPKIFQRGSSGVLTLLESGKFSDLKIVVKDIDGTTKDIPSHKSILAASSILFKDILMADPKMDSIRLNERYDVVMAG